MKLPQHRFSIFFLFVGGQNFFTVPSKLFNSFLPWTWSLISTLGKLSLAGKGNSLPLFLQCTYIDTRQYTFHEYLSRYRTSSPQPFWYTFQHKVLKCHWNKNEGFSELPVRFGKWCCDSYSFCSCPVSLGKFVHIYSKATYENHMQSRLNSLKHIIKKNDVVHQFTNEMNNFNPIIHSS